MVKKKGKVNKNEFLLTLAILIIGAFIVFVFANGVPTWPTPASSNFSGIVNFSCNVGMQNASNASLYFNRSGGAVSVYNATFLLGTGVNDTANSTYINITVDTSSFDDSSYYNITCHIANLSHSWVNTSSINNVTFDNNGPGVTDFRGENSSANSSVNAGYYNGTIVINASVNDSIVHAYGSPILVTVDIMRNISEVWVNITYDNGTIIPNMSNFTKASYAPTKKPSIGAYYNITVDTTQIGDGKINITFYANDSITNTTNGSGQSNFATNTNNSEGFQITIDNNAPTATYTCDPSSTTVGQAVTCTCTGADGLGSGINYTYDGSVTTTDGTAAVTTITETSAAGTFSRTCTVRDRKGYGVTASASYTISGAGSGGTGGGTSAGSWKTAGFPTDEELEAGYTQELAEMRRVKVEVTGTTGSKETHYVGVKEVTETSVTIQISSDPVEVELNVGEDAKVDVTDDGVYDIYVKLNAIVGSKADITVQKISEEIPEGEGAVTTTGEVVEEEPEPEPEPEEGVGLTWLWIVIGIIVIAVIIGAGIAVKKRK